MMTPMQFSLQYIYLSLTFICVCVIFVLTKHWIVTVRTGETSFGSLDWNRELQLLSNRN